MKAELINVAFPIINKNDTVKENNKWLSSEHRVNKCRVVKTLVCTPEEYNKHTKSLMTDNPIWENIGGQDAKDTNIDSAIYKEICKQDNEGKNWFFNEKLVNEFKKHCYTEVVELKCTDSNFTTLYINTEGHNYARYVGVKYADVWDIKSSMSNDKSYKKHCAEMKERVLSNTPRGN